MLDRVRKTIAPQSIEAEIADIEGALARLNDDREENRLAAAALVTGDRAGTADRSRDKAATEHHVKIAEIDGERRTLRARRRVLLDLLTPHPAAAASETVAGVAMPQDLRRAIGDLNAARHQRLEIIRAAQGDDTEKNGKAIRAKLDDLELRIDVLRKRRAELSAPYNEAVQAALSPVIRSAALRLMEHSRGMRTAVDEVAGICQMLPPSAPGMGNGLEQAASINLTVMHRAEAFAQTLIDANPPVVP